MLFAVMLRFLFVHVTFKKQKLFGASKNMMFFECIGSLSVISSHTHIKVGVSIEGFRL